MKMKMMLYCGAAFSAVVTGVPSQASVINLIDQGGVKGSKAEQGFNIAAAYWGSILTNNATINLGVRFAPLDEGVIGSTGSTRQDYSVANWERGIASSRSNSTVDQTAILPSLTNGGATFISSGVDEFGNDDTSASARSVIIGNTVSSNTLYLNTSVIKAIGGTVINPGLLDGAVTFSSTFGFDFDPTNGIDDDTFDFIGVAIHEIGHALGFVSGVDFLDVYGKPDGPGAGQLGYSLNDTSIYSSLDMFRYSKDPTNLVRGNDGVLDLSVDSPSYFSIDGGKTALFGNTFSTGRFNGDGNQASHWKDATGANRCGPQLGIMDPTFCFGQAGEVTALDLAAFDAFGWNTSVDALKNPNYLATTASIYRTFAPPVPEPATWALMMLGVGMISGSMRYRRRKTVLSYR